MKMRVRDKLIQLQLIRIGNDCAMRQALRQLQQFPAWIFSRNIDRDIRLGENILKQE